MPEAFTNYGMVLALVGLAQLLFCDVNPLRASKLIRYTVFCIQTVKQLILLTGVSKIYSLTYSHDQHKCAVPT